VVNTAQPHETAVINNRGVGRWNRGHPWVFRSDLVRRPGSTAGVVLVTDERGKPQGQALWSPASEISLRLLTRNVDLAVDDDWWRAAIGAAVGRRASITHANAYRLIHGEGDGLPSLVCDRYDRWLVVQLMSAGLERYREMIIGALRDIVQPDGILARNDVPLRRKEELPVGVELLHGSVPEHIEVVEHGVRFVAAPWTGQKTGAFLDQRENRAFIGGHARGRALDCFSYHGSFALHLARRAESVVALDVSRAALERAEENATRNGFTNLDLVEGDAFEFLSHAERAGERFDTVVLDPPAFAKNRAALPKAIRGYKDINMRAMRILAPGGKLFTASCSFHLTKPLFLDMLESAAADSGRRIALRTLTGQPIDHPELLTVPETGYLKGALLEAVD
jgi:23S rRNA (cytosine1962-C5)-methyltransferase